MLFMTADILLTVVQSHIMAHGVHNHILPVNNQRLKQTVCALLLFSISVEITPPHYSHLCC